MDKKDQIKDQELDISYVYVRKTGGLIAQLFLLFMALVTSNLIFFLSFIIAYMITSGKRELLYCHNDVSKRVITSKQSWNAYRKKLGINYFEQFSRSAIEYKVKNRNLTENDINHQKIGSKHRKSRNLNLNFTSEQIVPLNSLKVNKKVSQNFVLPTNLDKNLKSYNEHNQITSPK